MAYKLVSVEGLLSALEWDVCEYAGSCGSYPRCRNRRVFVCIRIEEKKRRLAGAEKICLKGPILSMQQRCIPRGVANDSSGEDARHRLCI